LRTTITAVMYLGFPLGVGAGGFIAASLIPAHGWRAMFVLGGGIPILLLPFAVIGLPESIRFLVARGDSSARVAQLLNRLTRSSRYTAADSFIIGEEKTQGFPVGNLFREGRALTTALLWTVFFCNLLVIYFLNAWLPTVLRETGIPLATAFRLTGAPSWGGVAAILLLGPLVDRLGTTAVVSVLFIGAACSVFAIGFAGGNVLLLAIAITFCGGCITAGQSFSNVLAAGLYPTTIRSTGVAWALGMGRAGTMLGPVAGSLMLQAALAPAAIFFSAAAPASIAAVSMLTLGWRLRRGRGGDARAIGRN
jgi:MFS transporter, AAHS family, 4-hydroxybenzoate transporter